jgi:hypothetical protein
MSVVIPRRKFLLRATSFVGSIAVSSFAAKSVKAQWWDWESAQNALITVYRQVLERSIDESGANTYSRRLVEGGWTLQKVVFDLGNSVEYNDRFIAPFSYFDAANLMYNHFLDREPESDEVVLIHARGLETKGQEHVVRGFVYSDEYYNTFGLNRPPVR